MATRHSTSLTRPPLLRGGPPSGARAESPPRDSD